MNEQILMKFGSWQWEKLTNTINQQWEERLDKMVAEIEHVYEYLDKYDTGALPTSFEKVMEIINKYRKNA